MAMTNAERQRKHRAKNRLKRELLKFYFREYEAATKTVSLIEGALLIHDGVGDFAILQWDEEAEDFLVTHRGRLDEVPPKD